MRFLSHRFDCWKSLLGAAVLGLTATAASAQSPAAPEALPTPPTRAATAPCAVPPPYCQPYPGYTPMPSGMPSTGMEAGGGAPEAGAESGAFRGLTSGAGYSSSTAVGYIDSAIPQSQIRIRADAAFDDNEPDRAAFFYAKCRCFAGAPGHNATVNPNSKVDFQEVSAYGEYALSDRFSTFLTLPLRFVEPTTNPIVTPGATNGDTGGFSDLDFGFKYAFLMDPCQVGTFQFRTYAPTGNPVEELGNNLWALEPAFLYFRRLSERWTLEAELRDWIPVGTTDDFAGNIVRYGVGLSYQAYKGPSCRVAPVVEMVGWTVLSGKEVDLAAAGSERSAQGDTIVNAKFGVRIGLGDGVSPGWRNQSDMYFGYGQALTDNIWYKDIYRIELRMRF